MPQFNRNYILQISGEGEQLVIKDLKIVFEVSKDILGHPNIAKIEVYNLSETSRNKISEKFSKVILRAGYGDKLNVLFEGQLRNISNSRANVDIISTLFCGDGEKAFRQAFVSHVFPSGVGVRQIVEVVFNEFKKFGISLGNKFVGVPNFSLSQGFSSSEMAKDLLDKLAEAYDFRWLIEGDAFYTYPKDGFEAIDAFIINANTGMIGVPSLTEIGVDVKTLLNPQLKPMSPIKVQSEFPGISVQNLENRDFNKSLGDGFYRINKVVHRGDTRGQEWSTSIVSRRVANA